MDPGLDFIELISESAAGVGGEACKKSALLEDTAELIHKPRDLCVYINYRGGTVSESC